MFMKVIFLFYMLRSLKPWHSCYTFGITRKLSKSKGEMNWFRNVSKYDGEVIEYFKKSLKNHLNYIYRGIWVHS